MRSEPGFNPIKVGFAISQDEWRTSFFYARANVCDDHLQASLIGNQGVPYFVDGWLLLHAGWKCDRASPHAWQHRPHRASPREAGLQSNFKR